MTDAPNIEDSQGTQGESMAATCSGVAPLLDEIKSLVRDSGAHWVDVIVQDGEMIFGSRWRTEKRVFSFARKSAMMYAQGENPQFPKEVARQFFPQLTKHQQVMCFEVQTRLVLSKNCFDIMMDFAIV